MSKPAGFSYRQRKNGEVVISHHGRTAAVLRGQRADAFLAKIAEGDDQVLMATVTGNYKRGNERRPGKGASCLCYTHTTQAPMAAAAASNAAAA